MIEVLVSTKQEAHQWHQNQTEAHSLLLIPCDSLSNPHSQNTDFLKLSTNTNARSLVLKCSSTSAGETKPGVRPERHLLTQLAVFTCSCLAPEAMWIFLSFKTTQEFGSCTQILFFCSTQASGSVNKVLLIMDVSGSQHSSNNLPLTWDLQNTKQGYLAQPLSTSSLSQLHSLQSSTSTPEL